MKRVVFLFTYFCMVTNILSYANEIDYSSCSSIEDVIAKETQEIASISPINYEELAQLYVSRGESFLLNAQYEKAIEDFQNARCVYKKIAISISL